MVVAFPNGRYQCGVHNEHVTCAVRGTLKFQIVNVNPQIAETYQALLNVDYKAVEDSNLNAATQHCSTMRPISYNSMRKQRALLISSKPSLTYTIENVRLSQLDVLSRR